MSKGSASKQRDEARERLKALASAPTAPGQSQAARALEKSEPKAKATKSVPAKKPVSKESAPRAAVAETVPPETSGEKPEAKPKKPKVVHERAEKISISLHPQDQVRAERVEDALRKAGLIPRRAPTSFLLKVALAAFDEKKVEGLPEIVEKVRSQDGRGKWMHAQKR
jgi:hypothetical protein